MAIQSLPLLRSICPGRPGSGTENATAGAAAPEQRPRRASADWSAPGEEIAFATAPAMTATANPARDATVRVTSTLYTPLSEEVPGSAVV